jgi:hypothetical protein
MVGNGSGGNALSILEISAVASICALTCPDHPREQAPACVRRLWIGWLGHIYVTYPSGSCPSAELQRRLLRQSIPATEAQGKERRLVKGFPLPHRETLVSLRGRTVAHTSEQYQRRSFYPRKEGSHFPCGAQALRDSREASPRKQRHFPWTAERPAKRNNARLP